MLFSSMFFLWLFLPFVFLFNLLLKPRGQNLFLLFASLFFYAWGEPKYVLLMLVSIFINWGCGLLLQDAGRLHLHKRGVLWTGIVLNLLLLGYFKYLGLFVRSVNHLLRGEALTDRKSVVRERVCTDV